MKTKDNSNDWLLLVALCIVIFGSMLVENI